MINVLLIIVDNRPEHWTTVPFSASGADIVTVSSEVRSEIPPFRVTLVMLALNCQLISTIICPTKALAALIVWVTLVNEWLSNPAKPNFISHHAGEGDHLPGTGSLSPILLHTGGQGHSLG